MAANSGLEYGNFSGVGRVREKNEDYFGSFVLAKGHLFVVCDGMGGHKGGQRASQLTVDEIRKYVESTIELEPTVFLRRAVEKANEAVFKESRENEGLHGMGTTCVIMLVRPGPKPEGWIAHVGDSRIYRLRKGKITRLTKDHSKVQKMVDMGILSQKEAAEHPQKNVITKAIGIEQSVYPDVKQIDLCKNDRYILCTDGVTDLVSDEDLGLFAAREKEAQRLAESLVALSNERGGHDNATIQVVDLTRGPLPPKEGDTATTRRSTYLLLALLAVILAYLLLTQPFGSDKPKDSQVHRGETAVPDTTDAPDGSEDSDEAPILEGQFQEMTNPSVDEAGDSVSAQIDVGTGIMDTGAQVDEGYGGNLEPAGNRLNQSEDETRPDSL